MRLPRAGLDSPALPASTEGDDEAWPAPAAGLDTGVPAAALAGWVVSTRAPPPPTSATTPPVTRTNSSPLSSSMCVAEPPPQYTFWRWTSDLRRTTPLVNSEPSQQQEAPTSQRTHQQSRRTLCAVLSVTRRLAQTRKSVRNRRATPSSPCGETHSVAHPACGNRHECHQRQPPIPAIL